MSDYGKKIWFFPDGDLPNPGDGELMGHESLVLLNPNEQDADVSLTIYFTDRDPVVLHAGSIGAERVRCIRTNEPIDGFQIPFGQYAIKVESTVGVIAQIGRMDVTQPNLAFYTTMGFGT
ncbi:MAG: sensory rhodopsin transducer [Pirellulales bacterium]|nr:sensory rhodopsin transducer [Pirellulales bacterium]